MKRENFCTPVSELTHIALRCRDLEATIAFYKFWCGLEALHRRSDRAPDGKHILHIAWLGLPPASMAAPAFVLVFMQTPVPPGATSLFDHLGFAVQSRAEVDRIANAAEQAGILHWPAADAGPIVGYLCALKDPDGNVVEFSFGQELGRHAVSPQHALK